MIPSGCIHGDYAKAQYRHVYGACALKIFWYLLKYGAASMLHALLPFWPWLLQGLSLTKYET